MLFEFVSYIFIRFRFIYRSENKKFWLELKHLFEFFCVVLFFSQVEEKNLKELFDIEWIDFATKCRLIFIEKYMKLRKITVCLTKIKITIMITKVLSTHKKKYFWTISKLPKNVFRRVFFFCCENISKTIFSFWKLYDNFLNPDNKIFLMTRKHHNSQTDESFVFKV